jgi:adenine-specific DNA-methyltransferase
MTENNIDKKLRGGYYTPKFIASFITRWVVREESDNVLEPSCGDGQFIEAAIEQFISIKAPRRTIPKKITGVELNPTEAKKAIKRFSNNLLEGDDSIITEDFFTQCLSWLNTNTAFSGIIGNPPFIRYQDFPDQYRVHALELMKQANLKPNKLMNTWIPFVVGSTLLLKTGGRIGLVLPAELFQVNYAAAIRRFLSESYSKIIVITFKKLVFEGIQQEVVLLLGEKNGSKSHGINIIEIEDMGSLDDSVLEQKKISGTFKAFTSSTEKWTQYLLDKEEVELLRKLRKHPNIQVTGDLIEVDVGVVTGQNKFFVLKQDQVREHNLENHTRKILSKSIQLKGVEVTEKDFEQSAQSGYSHYLIDIPDTEYEKLPPNLQKYVDAGEKDEVNKGYKCRIRKRWWVVPSTWVPDAFMLRQIHTHPKIIINKCQATATDTIHRVRFSEGINGEAIASAFLNSLSFAFSEISGRSYGGGVLTFEPSEAENIPLPMIGLEHLDFPTIDAQLRKGELESVLDRNDEILLKEGLKLSDNEITSLRRIWIKLRDRRIYRKRSQK